MIHKPFFPLTPNKIPSPLPPHHHRKAACHIITSVIRSLHVEFLQTSAHTLPRSRRLSAIMGP